MYVLLAQYNDHIDSQSTVVSVHHTLEQAQYRMYDYWREEFEKENDMEDWYIYFNDKEILATTADEYDDSSYKVSIHCPGIPLVKPTIPPYKMEGNKVVKNEYPF